MCLSTIVAAFVAFTDEYQAIWGRIRLQRIDNTNDLTLVREMEGREAAVV